MEIDQVTNVKRFRELMAQVNRDGVDKLIDYIENKTDFYTAPASTRFHLSCEGGLLQHSLNVYDCLATKRESPFWRGLLKDISDESLIIISLLHDICKTNFYVASTRNQKTYDPEKVSAANPYQVKHDSQGNFIWETVPSYDFDDKMPLGHGEKSVIIISRFITLNTNEIFAIRWHMGFSEAKENWTALGSAMEKYPVVLAIHEADLEASKVMEAE